MRTILATMTLHRGGDSHGQDSGGHFCQRNFFDYKIMQGRGWSDSDNTAMATATSPLTPFCHDSDTGNNDGDAGEWTVTGGTAGKDITSLISSHCFSSAPVEMINPHIGLKCTSPEYIIRNVS